MKNSYTDAKVTALVASKFARAINVYTMDIYSQTYPQEYVFDVVERAAGQVIVQKSDYVAKYGSRTYCPYIIMAL